MNVNPRGSYAVGRRRREQILDAATALIEQQGYYRTSMLEVAQAVGISESGLLHHFPSKQHLLLAVAERRFEEDVAWWAELPEHVDGLEVFERMVEATKRGASSPFLIELGAILTAEAVDKSSPAHEMFQARYREAIKDLTARLQRGLVREGYTDVDCEAIARDCIAFNDGIHLQWVISGGQIDLARAVEAHLNRIAADIRGPAVTR